MTVKEYIIKRGLSVRLVAQKMGVRRQAVDKYGKVYAPTEKTLTRIAAAMTELGAPTTVVDLFTATHERAAE